jgi:hypothetical protein
MPQQPSLLVYPTESGLNRKVVRGEYTGKGFVKDPIILRHNVAAVKNPVDAKRSQSTAAKFSNLFSAYMYVIEKTVKMDYKIIIIRM